MSVLGGTTKCDQSDTSTLADLVTPKFEAPSELSFNKLLSGSDVVGINYIYMSKFRSLFNFLLLFYQGHFHKIKNDAIL